SPPYFLRRQRQCLYPRAGAPKYRIRYSGRDRNDATFAQTLGAVGSRPVAVFDENRFEFVRYVLKGRHFVIDKGGIDNLPALPLVRFIKRVAESHHRRAFVLSLALERMDRFAGVGGGDVFLDVNFASLAIYRNFYRANANFPEQRIGRRRRHAAMRVTGADQFTALIGEVLVDQCAIADFLAAG